MMSSIVNDVIYSSTQLTAHTFAMSIRLSICWCDFDSNLINSDNHITHLPLPSFQKL